ncbi:hypothetical protein Agub_g4687 [Astrephomene gubernaculifera]|uniref:Uncharacterized protein n=1 Tax=Astrephomene gubernaculifera TaxID=47775 RepID=A0AAD3DKJ8_9CHLO|nr:hypothetical protein Agub_g4687 [Astrephomene gubernaculifera]
MASDDMKSSLLRVLTTLGCKEPFDDAVLDYACGVLESAVEDLGEEDDNLEHLDLLLSGACGEQYEATAAEERCRLLATIVDEARRRASGSTAQPSSGAPLPSSHAVGVTQRLGGLDLTTPGSAVGRPASSSRPDQALGRSGSTSSRGAENVSPTGDPDRPFVPSRVVQELAALCSGAASEEFLQYTLERKFGGSAEAVAAWLLDSEPGELEAAQEEWQELRERELREQEEARLLKERNKQQILQKFDLRPVPESKDPKKQGKGGPALDVWNDKQQPQQPKVRYLDGRVVSTKGEKFIIEKDGEDWDGGSRGKVYTKGKRGKGFV